MIVIGFGLSFLGCILLSLSMKRHYTQVNKSGRLSKPAAVFLRVLSSLCLFASGAICIHSDGLGVGLVWWWGLLTLTALLQTLLLTYRLQWFLVLKSTS
ncbi:MAG: hypothetical protein ACI965_000680 [Paraglaciecola sp.]|jgi:hypothetical protein